jgi:hypothetical protein
VVYIVPRTKMDGANNAELSQLLNDKSILRKKDVDDIPVDGAENTPVSSNWAYDHVAAADPHTGYSKESDIDDTPVNGETAAPISSNWAYDHAASVSAHGIIYNNSGTYVGDSSANKAIAHGIGRVPGIIHIWNIDTWTEHFQVLGVTGVVVRNFTDTRSVTGANSTNFYVGTAGSYAESANNTGVNYLWIAL